MSNLFTNIQDFLTIREKCFFCDAELKCRLTNFVGTTEAGLPLLNSPLENGRFIFALAHTSPSYTVEAEGTLDTLTNRLKFDAKIGCRTPTLDNILTKDIFIDLRPHIRLYCPKRKCPYQYTVAGDLLRAGGVEQLAGWLIFPFKLYYESFLNGKLWVQNDYINCHTNISSAGKGWDAEPLTVPLMDFKAMGQEKLLIRTRTLVVFS